MSAFFAGIQNILSLVPAPLLLTAFLLSHLSNKLHSFLPLLYFRTFHYLPCDSWSFLPIISALRFLSRFPNLSFCLLTYVCTCVQGACFVGGFVYHKASKQISLSKQTIPEKMRKYNCKFCTSKAMFHIQKFYILYSEGVYVFYTRLIKIAVIFLYSL
jgi:hypothetical protein